MAELKFYRGSSDKYEEAKHGNGVYFATDTFQIIHAGRAYGAVGQLDFTDYASKDFVYDAMSGCVKELEYSEATGEFKYTKTKKVQKSVTTETGEVITKTEYEDTDIIFSIRSLVVGNIKNLSFTNAKDGTGRLMYDEIVEGIKETETGELITVLDKDEIIIEIPNASYVTRVNDEGKVSYTYKSGLMSGPDKLELNNLRSDVEAIEDTISWKDDPAEGNE